MCSLYLHTYFPGFASDSCARNLLSLWLTWSKYFKSNSHYWCQRLQALIHSEGKIIWELSWRYHCVFTHEVASFPDSTVPACLPSVLRIMFWKRRHVVSEIKTWHSAYGSGKKTSVTWFSATLKVPMNRIITFHFQISRFCSSLSVFRFGLRHEALMNPG